MSIVDEIALLTQKHLEEMKKLQVKQSRELIALLIKLEELQKY